MTDKIWCLFSIANDYDQPNNNLVAWWPAKPSLETLAPFVMGPLDRLTDDQIVTLVTIWTGKEAQRSLGDTTFRLEEVEANKSLD